VVGIDGIVLQCDADDPISALFIRPIQELSLRFRGRAPRDPHRGVPLANHAGIKVRIAFPDGYTRAYVAEQLNGTLVQNVDNALSWTPWDAFQAREGRGGWDVTVPASAFECVEPADVRDAIDRLNQETGQPFFREFCTAFIERMFGGKHLFDNVEVLDWLVPGPGPRFAEPAAPCLKRHARLSPRARYLLRADALPTIHSAVDAVAKNASRMPDPSDVAAARQAVVRRYHDPRQGPARVLAWLWSEVLRSVAVRWRA
jgi:hypothetical protein